MIALQILIFEYLIVNFRFHSFFQVRLELGVFVPDLLRTILQSQSPQNGDAGVHHVDLAERVNVHLEGVLI